MVDKYSVSVKVMRSYDYCHFEIALSSSEELTLKQIDEMRKEAQRLVDKAVKQYRIAKADAGKRHGIEYTIMGLKDKVDIINENFPKSHWTPEQKAIIKEYEDSLFRQALYYNYEDDWDYVQDDSY